MTEDEEMGCVGSDGEDEIRPTTTNNNRKRFKLSKKVIYFLKFNSYFLRLGYHFFMYLNDKVTFYLQFFDECNNVDHASVPRKLRSGLLIFD